MKLLKLLSVSALIALAFAPVRAQENAWMRVEVPFSFVAGGQTLPAGNYIFQQTTDSGLMMVHGRGEGHAAAFLTTLVLTSSGEQPGAKFISVQGQKYLNRIDLTDGTVRAVVMKPAK